jgi:hypothetical protein
MKREKRRRRQITSGIFLVNPIYLVYIGLFIEAITLLRWIWQKKRNLKHNNQNTHNSSLAPRRYIHAYTIELLVGFLTIESLITLIFKNDIGYVVPRYYIFPVILASVISFFNLIRAFANFLNRRILIIQLIDLVYMTYIVGIYWVTHWGWFQILWFFLPIVLNPILEVLIWLFPPFHHESPLWDGRYYVEKFIPIWVHVLIFVLCLLETTLQYRGYSVLVWA